MFPSFNPSFNSNLISTGEQHHNSLYIHSIYESIFKAIQYTSHIPVRPHYEPFIKFPSNEESWISVKPHYEPLLRISDVDFELIPVRPQSEIYIRFPREEEPLITVSPIYEPLVLIDRRTIYHPSIVME